MPGALTQRQWLTSPCGQLCPSVRSIDCESQLVCRAAAIIGSRDRLCAEVGVLETGVDIVEIPRVGDLLNRYGDRFRRRVYTDQEWADSNGRIASLAARFAAKEATIKAL